jgi:hypothetical protein
MFHRAGVVRHSGPTSHGSPVGPEPHGRTLRVPGLPAPSTRPDPLETAGKFRKTDIREASRLKSADGGPGYLTGALVHGSYAAAQPKREHGPAGNMRTFGTLGPNWIEPMICT